MNKRTTDRNATKQFFEKHHLDDAVEAYFASPFIQANLQEGYMRYVRNIDVSEYIPQGEEKLMAEIIERYTITREIYEQMVFEIFKEMFKDTFELALEYLSIRPSLLELLKKYEDENLIILLRSSMNVLGESMSHRIEIAVKICLETNVPLEIAEIIADDIGDTIGTDNFIIEMVECVPESND